MFSKNGFEIYEEMEKTYSIWEVFEEIKLSIKKDCRLVKDFLLNIFKNN